MLSVAESDAATLKWPGALMMTNDFGVYASAGYPRRGSRFSRAFYLFSWSVVGVAGVLGLLFSLYRNDVLLEQARRRGMEKPYLALERRLLGTPGWGTPRSLATSAELLSASAVAPEASVALAVTSPAAAESKPASAAATDSAATPAAETKPATPLAAGVTSEGVKITSLDALTPLPRGAAVARIQAPVTHAVAESRPAPAVKAHVAEPKAASRFVAASEPKPKAAAAKAAPEPKPARTPKAAPIDDNPLNAAIRGVIAKDAAGK